MARDGGEVAEVQVALDCVGVLSIALLQFPQFCFGVPSVCSGASGQALRRAQCAQRGTHMRGVRLEGAFPLALRSSLLGQVEVDNMKSGISRLKSGILPHPPPNHPGHAWVSI